ncbi:DUF4844 domain-containing protein [Terrimonas sp. NA20]|uniref:DUF4844 domain-containing protein n=1 Tax=Terrimonas ginsenosidimutans TaxID=2908004 RepID=A0ABS9KN53_9BACT|nr:DUF4844 domain-containing protein [Terrimonas ginsenosidimutans]MCG2613762.1 DUF4844 domain-containing protein [Terrimonas ginsenosidimutans]
MEIMPAENEKVKLLGEFISRDKFSDEAWNKRGLNPSAPEMSSFLGSFFNDCALNLTGMIESGTKEKKLKLYLKSSLRSLNRWDYDTEEKEFICDLFMELAHIVGVDIRRMMNRWLYGYVLVFLMELVRFIRPERVLERHKERCSQCNAEMEVLVLKKGERITPRTWMILQCGACNGYDLHSDQENSRLTRYVNCHPVEYLPKDEYSHEQALIRLEQVRYFRKH